MRRLLLLLALAACHPPSVRPTLPLQTTAEQSHWVKTGRYDEAVALCHDFARAYAGVLCEQIGTTGEDRPIVALVIQRARTNVPAIYIEGGIHAGEIEGKDAGFWFLRDLLDGKVAPGALDAVDLIFVPVINPDGHERFGANNRPNQRGPLEMGFRTNGARDNLNRDFVKADTPEIQALLGVITKRDPIMLVDIHTTDGAKFQHDISVEVAPVAARPDHLEQAAGKLGDAIVARLTALGHLPITFYPSFVTDDDPASGFALGEAPPRFSQVYMATRSKLGILVENHSWKTYAERVTSTYHFLQALLEQATTQAPAWLAATRDAQRADLALGGTRLPVVFDNGPHTTTIAFRGYAYERKPSEISGATWTIYDEHTPQIWNVPLRDEIVPKVTVDVPKAGYIVDGGFAKRVAAVLDHHGIHYTRLDGQPRLDVTAFRATKVQFLPPFEGRTRVALEGAWAHETRTLDRGAIFVPIAQDAARLIVHLLDPAAPDSLAQWGELDEAFERKEYMEPYVAEEEARKMLAADPSLKAQFDAALAADPALAASPERRLGWFYQRHPAWDERVNLLPIFRVDVAP